MPNTIEYAKLYQKTLDELALQELKTAWMEDNAGQVIYNGGNEVKIPKMSLDGLAKYDRSTGYAAGSVSLAYETRSLTQDRGRKFSIDAMDVDETSFAATAAAILGSFQREKVVPEIDAYRMAALYAKAVAANQATEETPTATTVLAELKRDITKVKKAGAQAAVVHIRYDILSLLETALAGQLRSITWAVNGVDTTVPSLDGCPLVPMEDARMYKQVTISATNGYTGTGTLNWVVVGRVVPLAISKTDKPRIFTPDQNQDADAYVVTYRKYHDIWVLDNKAAQIAASYLPASNG